ncbi:MAG: SseB family protein, partial [Micromonosporaceae bacterium]
MPGLITPGDKFGDDDGSAEPRLEAVLSAYAAGRESEHAVLTVLAHARLLVPVVAALTEVEDAPRPGGG